MARIDVSRLSDGGPAGGIYDPRSGNTPDSPTFIPAAVVVTQNGEQIQIDSSGRSASGSVPIGSTKPLASNVVFTPVATIVTQSGEEIQVDSSGRAADGSVPVGTTKPKPVAGTGAGAAGSGTLPPRPTPPGISPGQAARQSAYDLLFEQFSKYGLGSLVEPLKGLITSGVSPAEFTIKLRETPAYQKRFAANAERIKKGLTPLVEGDYLALEDQYQNIMRNYGLPETYWTRGDLGTQEGFQKLLANDVSASELENRILTAQDRVLKANPQVLNTLKAFYGDSITNGDILAYSLDPQNALKDIQRKVTAAEIGGAAAAAGLSLGKTPEQIAASEARAQMLAGYGVTKDQAMTGFQTVAEVAPRGSQLAEFYNRPTYGQMEAEQEVFNLEGAAAARKKRQELVGLEQAAFAGKAGAAQGALGRERAGNL